MSCVIEKLKNNKGFTLVEALISVFLVSMLVLGVMGMFTTFSKLTGQDIISTCLVQAASSAIEAKRSNHSLNSLDLSCGSLNVTVTITGNPPSTPPNMGSGQSACAEVTAVATAKGRSMTLRDWVCNFPQG